MARETQVVRAAVSQALPGAGESRGAARGLWAAGVASGGRLTCVLACVLCACHRPSFATLVTDEL